MTAKKKISIVIIVIAAAAVLGLGGYLLWGKFFSSSGENGHKVYVQKVSSVNTVSEFNIAANSFTGVVEAKEAAKVKYDPTKTVKKIYVKEGDKVKKGDKLFSYDVEDIGLQLDQAKLEVERMQGEIESNNSQITELQNEKKNASGDEAVSYNTQILSLKSDNAKTEYDIKATNVEIKKLEKAKSNCDVTSPAEGTVKDLKSIDQLKSGSDDGDSDEMNYYSEAGSGDSQDVIMKISADTGYLIKGTVNEQNLQSVGEGTPVVVKSRVDDTKWKGTVDSVDSKPMENKTDIYGGGEEEDEGTKSSNYAFYVKPESLDGFKLGQHIIIQLDLGQSEHIEKTGIWLYSDFICKDGDKSYVWAKDSSDKIEKRYIEIGQTDDKNGDCEIKSGLETSDYIAYPSESIKEGMETSTNESDMSIPENDLAGMNGGDADGEDMMDEGDMEEAEENAEGENGENQNGEDAETVIDTEKLESMTDEEAEEYIKQLEQEGKIDPEGKG